MKIAIGSDHRGFPLKEGLKKYLSDKKIEFADTGTNSAESVDYPDYAKKVCEAVVNGGCDFGVLVCGSGIGVSISANRFRGIRAVNATNNNMAEMSRRHNNANVICFGSDFVDLEHAERYLEIFLNTDFEGGERHERRIKKMDTN